MFKDLGILKKQQASDLGTLSQQPVNDIGALSKEPPKNMGIIMGMNYLLYILITEDDYQLVTEDELYKLII